MPASGDVEHSAAMCAYLFYRVYTPALNNKYDGEMGWGATIVRGLGPLWAGLKKSPFGGLGWVGLCDINYLDRWAHLRCR